MADMIFVKPAPGGRIRQPERNYIVMPEEGAFVPGDSFYQRLIASGDVIETDAPTKKKAAAPDKGKQSAEPKPAE